MSSKYLSLPIAQYFQEGTFDNISWVLNNLINWIPSKLRIVL